MKKALLKYGGVFILLALSAGGLMRVSQNVQKVERDIAATDRAIEREQEKIRVLKAEWAYLNNPARLESLARDAFGLDKTNMSSVVSTPSSIPEFTVPQDEGDVLSQSIPIAYGGSNGGGG